MVAVSLLPLVTVSVQVELIDSVPPEIVAPLAESRSSVRLSPRVETDEAETVCPASELATTMV